MCIYTSLSTHIYPINTALHSTRRGSIYFWGIFSLKFLFSTMNRVYISHGSCLVFRWWKINFWEFPIKKSTQCILRSLSHHLGHAAQLLYVPKQIFLSFIIQQQKFYKISLTNWKSTCRSINVYMYVRVQIRSFLSFVIL